MCLNCESELEKQSCLYINNFNTFSEYNTVVYKKYIHNRMSKKQTNILLMYYEKCFIEKKYIKPDKHKILHIVNILNSVGGSYLKITYKIVLSWFKNHRNRAGRLKSINKLKLIRKLHSKIKLIL